MTEIEEEEVSVINTVDCGSCGEEITLLHLKGKYVTIKSMAVPALFGAGGYSLGGSAGIAALGTAWTASWPLAAVGALVGGSAIYVAGATKDSLQCPDCEVEIEV
ncbi:hypothetical protein [Salinibaculum rarum]|uniref:hypothetical protein n=1 Tax=Salinibaculum rarum TaxID=3058903 RepID=UPI00265F83BE|nr:hypothetical protein [Salinibaculum sp. KK48]